MFTDKLYIKKTSKKASKKAMEEELNGFVAENYEDKTSNIVSDQMTRTSLLKAMIKTNNHLRFAKKFWIALMHTRKYPDDINIVGAYWLEDNFTIAICSSILGNFLGLKPNSINTNLRCLNFQSVNDFGFGVKHRLWKKRQPCGFAFSPFIKFSEIQTDWKGGPSRQEIYFQPSKTISAIPVISVNSVQLQNDGKTVSDITDELAFENSIENPVKDLTSEINLTQDVADVPETISADVWDGPIPFEETPFPDTSDSHEGSENTKPFENVKEQSMKQVTKETKLVKKQVLHDPLVMFVWKSLSRSKETVSTKQIMSMLELFIKTKLEERQKAIKEVFSCYFAYTPEQLSISDFECFCKDFGLPKYAVDFVDELLSISEIDECCISETINPGWSWCISFMKNGELALRIGDNSNMYRIAIGLEGQFATIVNGNVVRTKSLMMLLFDFFKLPKHPCSYSAPFESPEIVPFEPIHYDINY